MSAPVTALYAALVALLFLWLSARVILRRRGRRVSLGTGGDVLLALRVRAQANLAENAPLALLLMALLEGLGGWPWLLHALGLLLLGGRLAHAAAFSSERRSTGPLRPLGMALTQTALLGAALGCLVLVAWGGPGSLPPP